VGVVGGALRVFGRLVGASAALVSLRPCVALWVLPLLLSGSWLWEGRNGQHGVGVGGHVAGSEGGTRGTQLQPSSGWA
jgi:hypothetical protein